MLLASLKIYDKNSKDFIIHDNWKNKIDFIGLNYYRSIHVYQCCSCFIKIFSRMVSDLHISHTYVHPLSPVGLLGLVDGRVLDFDMSFYIFT